MTTMSPGAFASLLRRAAREHPKKTESALREAGDLLAGPIIQEQIDSTDPVPVMDGQYRGSWRSEPIPGGARVFSIAKHAIFVERGRGPGPVPSEPIVHWMRKKGIPDDALFPILRSLRSKGFAGRFVLRRGFERLRPILPKLLSAHLGGSA